MAKSQAVKNFIGIYISPKEICLAQTRLTGDSKLEPEHLVHIPTDFPVKPGLLRPLALNNDFFDEKAAWVGALQSAAAKVNWNTSRAIVTLSQQFAILRYFVMPSVDKRFWNKSIPIESRKYIPVSFDEVIYDFNTCPIEGTKKLGVLFGLTQRKSVEFILNTLKAANLEMAAVEIAPCSMERMFAYLDPKDHAAKGYVHFSGGVSHMLFSSAGFPVLYRETDYESSSTLSESRRLDLKGAVQFVDRFGGQEYKQLMLSGEGAEVWQAMAQKESPAPVTVWEPARASALKSNSAASLFSIGASLRGRTQERASLDISGIGASARLEKEVEGYAWTITAVLSGLLLFLSLLGQVRVMLLDSTISRLSARLSSAESLANDPGESIADKIERMRADANLLDNLAKNRDVLSVKLHAIAEAIPSALWLRQINYTAPFAALELQNPSVDLKMSGETDLTGNARVKTVNDFNKALKSSPEFKIFTGPNASMEFSFGNESPGLRARRTGPRASGFTIECFSNRRKS